tara:strand:+ start:6405 stop:8705 length:2301 start_codon:yes stop_codon:yes gene_type:complete
MSWKKVLTATDVTSVQDLFTVASGDLPASGDNKALLIDSTGTLSVGDVGGTISVQDNSTSVVASASSIDFGTTNDYFTVVDNSGTAQIDLDLSSGKLDGDALLVGTATTGHHDWTIASTINTALSNIDTTLSLLAPPGPLVLGNSVGFNFGLLQISSNNETITESSLYKNDVSNTATDAYLFDSTTSCFIKFALTLGTNNDATHQAGAFKVSDLGTEFIKFEIRDVSAGAWDTFLDYTTTVGDNVFSDASAGNGNGIVTFGQDDFWDFPGSVYASGFWDCIRSVALTVQDHDGSESFQLGYDNNKFRIGQYESNGGALIGQLESDSYFFMSNFARESACTSHLVKADGSGTLNGAGILYNDDDGAGNSIYGNTYYTASGVTRYRLGDKVALKFNTAMFGYIKDAAGNYYMSSDNSGKMGTIGGGANERGLSHAVNYIPAHYNANNYITWNQTIGTNYIGDQPSNFATSAQAEDSGAYWTIGTNDKSDSYSNIDGADAIGDLKDLVFHPEIAGQSIASFNLNTGMTSVDTGSRIATIAVSPIAENSVRIKTLTGDYPNIGGAYQAYDSTKDIDSDTGYTDSLMFNGTQFYHPGHTADNDYSSSQHLNSYWSSYTGHDYTGIGSETSSSYRYMMQRHLINNAATNELKIKINGCKWISSVDGEGNLSGIKIFVKLRNSNTNASITNWFDACSNYGASPPSPGDANGTACHKAGSADNSYTGTQLTKIVNLGASLTNVEVLVRVGIEKGSSASSINTNNFTSTSVQANV